eukprot:g922.t1
MVKNYEKKTYFITSAVSFILLNVLWLLSPIVTHEREIEKCGWDSEGSWQVMAGSGDSPWNLKFDDPNSRVYSCKDVDATETSFVADPFLVIPPYQKEYKEHLNMEEDENQVVSVSPPWYLFFEMKNLKRDIGEIGVSQSINQGATWKHLGTALAEPFHLSFPFTRFLPHRSKNLNQQERKAQWIMIPEAGGSMSIRIYSTTPDQFPFGWRLAKIPLSGKKFVDTSAIFFEKQWWIFTMIYPEHSLHLYVASDILDGKWIEHKASPLRIKDRKYARPAGPPIIHGGQLFRFAQDCSVSYGEHVYVMKINIINNAEYEEEVIRKWNPPKPNQRFHHVDAHHNNELKLFPNEQKWIAVVDADVQTDMYSILPYPFGRLAVTSTLFARFQKHFLRVESVIIFILFVQQFVLKKNCIRYKQVKDFFKREQGEKGVKYKMYKTGGFFILALLIAHIIKTNIPILVHVNTLCKNAYHPDAIAASPTTSATTKLEDFVIVTGASKSFFQRLTNLVGSIHVQAMHENTIENVVIYDFGLTPSQRDEISCWKNVELRKLPFETLPTHVTDMTNYAWKIYTFADALAKNKSVLWIDSGLEIRRPDALDRIRYIMKRDGLFFTEQIGNIGDKTLTKTVTKLGLSLDDFYQNISHQPFCAGGFVGFIQGNENTFKIMSKALDCASRKDCISPKGAVKGNHHFDQSIISTILRHEGFQCQSRNVFAMTETFKLPELDKNGFAFSYVSVAQRRYRFPFPYEKFVQKKAGTCSSDKNENNREKRNVMLRSSKFKERNIERKGFDFDVFMIHLYCSAAYPVFTLILFFTLRNFEYLGRVLKVCQRPKMKR